ncbi:MAG: response regulator [Fimbriimonadales bacterium]|nr:response regulator [Fimbriimonadales bacterium]
MQKRKVVVEMLGNLTRLFLMVLALQMVVLVWGIGLDLTPTLFLQALAAAFGTASVVALLLHRTKSRSREATRLQHEQLLRLQRAIESSPAAIMLTGPDFKIQYVNPAFTALTGYTLEESVGCRPNILKSGLMPETFYTKLFETLKRGEQYHGRFLNRKKGTPLGTPENPIEFNPETHYWAEGVIAPIYDEQNKLLGYCSIHYDITEKVLHEQAVFRAKEEAERLAQARTEFLANTSHEIRTSMSGLLGMLNLLKETSLTDEQRDLLATADASAKQLLEVLNDILSLAKIEAGQVKLERTPTDLKRFVREVCETVRPQARLKGILLREELPIQRELYALVDTASLRQVLLNLLSNAIKFTDQGEVVVRVTGEEARDDKLIRLRFEVQDTGIGIASEKQAQIFEPFRQVHRSTPRKYNSTGLGLAICWKLVELMGGQMGLVSEVGKGATFWFELVLPVSEPPAYVQLEQQICASESTALTGLRVLVAEDNYVNQKVIRRTLERWGIEVEIAENGREVLEWLSRAPFHLVLMDCQMPDMDGYEATRRIRAYDHARGLHMPIIALTANALESDREKCIACGMDDYLSKPIDPDLLWEKLAQWGLPRLGQQTGDHERVA